MNADILFSNRKFENDFINNDCINKILEKILMWIRILNFFLHKYIVFGDFLHHRRICMLSDYYQSTNYRQIEKRANLIWKKQLIFFPLWKARDDKMWQNEIYLLNVSITLENENNCDPIISIIKWNSSFYALLC